MFYLIGGTPRSGKTTIAKALSKKLHIPLISTDTLESVVLEYIPESEIPILFPKKNMRIQTHNSNDVMYSQFTPEQIVEAYTQQGISMRKAITAFILSESSEGHNYIIEGHHITPELVSILEQRFELKAVFVGREDRNKTLEAMTNNPSHNDWVIEKTKNPQTFPLIAEMLAQYSSKFKKEAGKYNYSYIPMEDNFLETVQNTVDKF